MCFILSTVEIQWAWLDILFSVSKSHYLGGDLELTQPLIAVSARLRATQADLKDPFVTQQSRVGVLEHCKPYSSCSDDVVIHKSPQSKY